MDLPLWQSPLWYVVGAAVLGVALYFYLGGARQRALAELADERDPMRRWAKGVYGLITGGSDYAYGDKGELRTALSEWWGIGSTDDFWTRFNALCAAEPRTKPEAAWTWVRAVNLARMGAGAKFISNEESWERAAMLLPRIQASFAGWEDLGQSYRAAWEAWLRERGIDRRSVENVEETLAGVRKEVWRKVDFNAPLQSALAGGGAPAPTATDQLRALGYIAAGAIDWAIRFRALLVIIAVVLAAGLLWAKSFLSRVYAQEDLVGAWAGELSESGRIDDKRYDVRRWLTIVRADGTATRTMRWYLGRQRQEEAVTQYEWTVGFEWQVKDLVWRLICKQNSPGYECSRETYRISVDQSGLHYNGMRGSTEFTMRKVPADYRLP